MARIDVTPIIPNTTMKLYTNDTNTVSRYEITPITSYVLHDKGLDYPVYDEMTGEETIYEGFRRTTAAVPTTYDFEANPREFYTLPENEVPADQIFGTGNNNHEVM